MSKVKMFGFFIISVTTVLFYQNCGKKLNSELDQVNIQQFFEPEVCANPSKEKFVVKIYIDKPGIKLQAPLFDYANYDLYINWGDGKKDRIFNAKDPNAIHYYEKAGYYVVSFEGIYPHLGIDPSIKLQSDEYSFNWIIKDVCNWGTNKWQSMQRMFADSKLAQVSAKDLPDLTNVTDMSYMFYYASDLVSFQNGKSWDISKIKNMEGMFAYTAKFNEPIGNWDVSSVENFSKMFVSSGFNQDLSKWNTSSALNLSQMFATSAFNQPIGNWNVSKVQNMSKMFYKCF